MENRFQKSHQRLLIKQAVTASADFLSQYLALANAHPVDFIVQDAWNKILPSSIQTELCALTKQQLLQLPSSHSSCPNHNLSVQPGKEAAVCIETGNSRNQTQDHNLHSDGDQNNSDPVCPDHCSVQLSKETAVCGEVKNNRDPIVDPYLHPNRDQTHSKSDSDHSHHDHADTCRAGAGENVLQNELKNGSESRNVAWKHGSLKDFLAGVREHCLENMQCLKSSVDRLSCWLQDNNASGSDGIPFVHAFMKEKKMHEVEIMADLCAQMFNRSIADVVVDLGSGKGYLSTHLSLQCHLPVIGIDSQPHNTSGAVQRAVKIEKQWSTLVKYEQKKLQSGKENVRAAQSKTLENNYLPRNCSQNGKENINQSNTVGNTCLPGDSLADMATGQAVVHNETRCLCNEACIPVKDVQDYQKCSKSQRRPSEMTEPVPQSNPECETCEENQKTRSESTQILSKFQPDTIKHVERVESVSRTENQTAQPNLEGVNETQGRQPAQQKLEGVNETENHTAQPKLQDVNEMENQMTQPAQKNVAVTMFVNPDTKLADVVKDSANTLCPHKPAEEVRLLLTGLHTCGPLASSMLRLFVTDSAVRAMCGVGCCYQLMQERFIRDDSGLWQNPQTCQELGRSNGPERQDGDFPLSSVLLDKKMVIGRTALNNASLSLPRMTQCDVELQGKTYYPRALLQALIHKKLGYIPQDLKKLRKLARQAKDPPDYVRRGLQKLNIAGCQATEDEIRQFHEEHSHMEKKMGCFFQLRASLAPLVESVVLLDRLLYLLEQDCVEDAYLVRLFDPFTSPRCHAIIAIKKEHDQSPQSF